MITVDAPSRQHHLLVDAAVQLVERRIGRTGRVQVVFTDSRGMADLHARAEIDLMPQMTTQVRKTRAKILRRESRDTAGRTLLGPTAGSSLVLINTQQAPGKHLARTVVHELVHSVQLSAAQARRDHLRYLRHECEIEDMTAADVRQYVRQMGQQEREAERNEHLARHLTH